MPKQILCGLYAIYDNKAGAIVGPIMQHKHIATALRLFTDMMADPTSIAAKHPADFDLIHLGYLNDDVTIEPLDPFTDIMTGSQWLEQQKPKLAKES